MKQRLLGILVIALLVVVPSLSHTIDYYGYLTLMGVHPTVSGNVEVWPVSCALADSTVASAKAAETIRIGRYSIIDVAQFLQLQEVEEEEDNFDLQTAKDTWDAFYATNSLVLNRSYVLGFHLADEFHWNCRKRINQFPHLYAPESDDHKVKMDSCLDVLNQFITHVAGNGGGGKILTISVNGNVAAHEYYGRLDPSSEQPRIEDCYPMCDQRPIADPNNPLYDGGGPPKWHRDLSWIGFHKYYKFDIVNLPPEGPCEPEPCEPPEDTEYEVYLKKVTEKYRDYQRYVTVGDAFYRPDSHQFPMSELDEVAQLYLEAAKKHNAVALIQHVWPSSGSDQFIATGDTLRMPDIVRCAHQAVWFELFYGLPWANTNCDFPFIDIMSPTADATWVIGGQYWIEWTAHLAPGGVNVELSLGDGLPYQMIFEGITSSGPRLWTIENVTPTNQARIRISSVDDPWVYEISQPFTIAEPNTARFVVNTQTTDNSDANPGDGICNDGWGDCSLRAAIEEANATLGRQTIKFRWKTGGAPTIRPNSELPVITDSVIIDGTTYPDWHRVQLSGENAGNARGLFIMADDCVVRGMVINNFGLPGIVITRGDNNVIEGNYIGTDVGGAWIRGNKVGIRINDSVGNIIGGTAIGTSNVISGSTTHGVWIRGADSVNNLVYGNKIGSNWVGTAPVGNQFVGVLVSDGASFNRIGDVNTKTGNVIAFNGQDGVRITGDGVGNTVVYNEIHSNGEQGIDLAGEGATANDADDADTGANDLQNYPVITSVAPVAGNPQLTAISGGLDTEAGGLENQVFLIQVFLVDVCDPCGSGEGQVLIGEARVAVDENGDATFSVETSEPLANGDVITATATGDVVTSTSEFSQCFTVSSL